jgi:hypothetical protein
MNYIDLYKIENSELFNALITITLDLTIRLHSGNLSEPTSTLHQPCSWVEFATNYHFCSSQLRGLIQDYFFIDGVDANVLR